MKKLLIAVFGIFLLVGCQKPFESKDQAKNEVNKKGYKTGRWVEYVDENGKQTNDEVNYSWYLLSEYKDGKPIGNYKSFNKDNSLRSKGTFLSDETLYEKNIIPSKYIGIKILYEKNEVLQKQVYDSDGDKLKEVIHFKKENSSKGDSLTFNIAYYTSQRDKKFMISLKDIKEISIYINDEEQKRFFFDENSWTESLKYFDEFYDKTNPVIISIINKKIEELKKQNSSDAVISGLKLISGIESSRIYFNRVSYSTQKGGAKNDDQKDLKEFYEDFLHQQENTSLHNENNNYSNNQGNNINENENKSSSDSKTNCTCLDISDNPESYIGKTVQIELVYLDTRNSMVSLKMRNYQSEESLNTSMNIGLYDVNNDTYYFRIAGCNGGIEFYLQIPYSISSKLPNVTAARILVTGVLKNKNTIIVKSIRRS